MNFLYHNTNNGCVAPRVITRGRWCGLRGWLTQALGTQLRLKLTDLKRQFGQPAFHPEHGKRHHHERHSEQNTPRQHQQLAPQRHPLGKGERCHGKPIRAFARLHTQRAAIDIQKRFLFFHFRRLLPTNADDLTNDLYIKPGRFGFCKNILDIACERLALFFQAFDPFDNAPQPIRCNAPCCRIFITGEMFAIHIKQPSR
jgi:hypothetical protein